MSSRSTFYRHRRGDRINAEGYLTMVACSHCVSKSLGCKMSSLSSRCGNCYRDGIPECVPAHIPLPDFSKLDREIERLEEQERAVEVQMEKDEEAANVAQASILASIASAQRLVSEAQERSRASRAKLRRLHKQRKRLKLKEQEIFDEGRVEAEELEQLEVIEQFNQELASTNVEAPAEARVVDWSAFWPDPGLSFDPEQVGVNS
jgi:hypothetical protein